MARASELHEGEALERRETGPLRRCGSGHRTRLRLIPHGIWHLMRVAPAWIGIHGEELRWLAAASLDQIDDVRPIRQNGSGVAAPLEELGALHVREAAPLTERELDAAVVELESNRHGNAAQAARKISLELEDGGRLHINTPQ